MEISQLLLIENLFDIEINKKQRKVTATEG
jgi:hypothetical protein